MHAQRSRRRLLFPCREGQSLPRTRSGGEGAVARLASAAVLLLALAAPAAAQTGAVEGRVLDARSGQPVPGAAVRVDGTARGAAATADGRFSIAALPAGEAALTATAVGFREARLAVAVRAGETARVEIRLAPDVAALGEVVVQADAAALPTSLSLAGDALRERLGGSVAATLAGEPGLWMRSNGPAATQPVVRGLAGDRVLVLQDGLPTGDVATTAPDHAVTVEPLSARRIDVVRGPAALLYGSVVLGGVIDVTTDAVPETRPARVGASAQAQAESAVGGRAASVSGEAPLGPLAVRADAHVRLAGDTATPEGALPFTDADARGLGAGVAYVGRRVRVGAAARDVRQTYGVPSTFGGITLPGAHDGGVYVDLHRQSLRAEASVEGLGPFARVEALGQATRFYQAEFEQGGFVGTEFGQLLHALRVVGRYGAAGRARGGVGASAQNRDWAAAGSQTGTRPAIARSAAVFFFHEQPLGGSPLGPLTLQAGARLDAQGITPRDTTSSRIASGRRLTGIRARRFAQPSGALALVAAPRPGVDVGAQVVRSVRLPAVEELFSNGPHLASFAYEVGNPGLGPEVGVGAEAFARLDRGAWRADVTLFANHIAGFVRYAPLVGDDGRPLLDYRLRRYEVYQAAQGPARFFGVEARAHAPLGRGWALDATAQALRGTDLEVGGGLPFVPPAHARLGLSREVGRLRGGLRADAAAPQRRVPAPPPALAACPADPTAAGCPDALPGEFVPTAGRVLVGGWVGWRADVAGTAHALTLRLDNALDRAYRDPLSRVKSVAPEVGRNVSLTYRVDL